MSASEDAEWLSQLKKAVVDRLAWKEAGQWKHRDYELFSEMVFQETGAMISVSTLKRLFGKVAYDGLPSIHTLDTLSRFAGHDSWLAFIKSLPLPSAPKDTVVAQRPDSDTAAVADRPQAQAPAKALTVWIGLGFLAVLAFAMLWRVWQAQPSDESWRDQVSIELAKPVQMNAPQTIYLRYQIPDFSVDSFFISPYKEARYLLNPQDSLVTLFMAEPGIKTARIQRSNGQTVDSLIFMIYTDDWITYYRNTQKLKEDEITQLPSTAVGILFDSGVMRVGPEQFGLKPQQYDPKTTLVHFYLYRPFEVSADNFAVEARFRNRIEDGSFTCQKSVFTVLTNKSFHEVSLVGKGCSNFCELFINRKLHRSNRHDLTPFEQDLAEWQQVRMEIKDQLFTVFVNGEKVYTSGYTGDSGVINGIKFYFYGFGGQIDEVRLFDENRQLVYEENFDLRLAQ